ncbi:MAG: hypothetical protein A2939_00825 [Parcubacteria group bacterium RIFCSPLOWO2_01_FULL_48_18]|nr:MAG: hypothetical protein A3J67_04465 [Parcubacteria group bacterium RIFCSPHIGHO2_02_FULL_48_10b]OHB22020.1 MAG: hypothetical protein A2939_00825 [Parcubacteria group bacterium RIFCSPLOWO2_01_FULL_48_18]
MVEVKRKEGESISSLIYRFSRRVQQSGVVLDVKKRRFRKRPPNRLKIKLSALHRLGKRIEFEKKRKLGQV